MCETDRRLWALLTGVLVTVLGVAEYLSDPESGWIAGCLVWARGGFEYAQYVAPSLAATFIGLLAVVAAVAWVAQFLLVKCGFRLGAKPDLIQAADYRELSADEPEMTSRGSIPERD